MTIKKNNRKDIVSNSLFPKEKLIRVVVIDNNLLIDSEYKSRAIYILDNKESIDKLLGSKILEKETRKFKREIKNLNEFKLLLKERWENGKK